MSSHHYGVAALTLLELIDIQTASRDSGPLELLIFTWCPVFANKFASVAPIFPEPIIPIFIFSVSLC